jgi:hypothetical protein
LFQRLNLCFKSANERNVIQGSALPGHTPRSFVWTVNTLDVRGFGARHQRRYALLVFDGVPFNELAGARAVTVLGVRPSLPVEFCGFETVSEQVSDDVVGEKLHAAIGMVDDKPLARTQ